MNRSIYIGKVIDGGWEVSRYVRRPNRQCYILYNKVRNQYIAVNRATLLNLLDKRTTVSHIISSRIRRGFWKNGKTTVNCTANGEPIEIVIQHKNWRR